MPNIVAWLASLEVLFESLPSAIHDLLLAVLLETASSSRVCAAMSST